MLVQSVPDFEADVFRAQRSLRTQLLDRGAVRSSRMRDFAAHLLLYLDQPDRIFQTTVEWLRVHSGAERADGGYCNLRTLIYRPGQFECVVDEEVPSLSAARVDTRVSAAQEVWQTPHSVIFPDPGHDRRFGPELSVALKDAGTVAKAGRALRFQGREFAFICVDRAVVKAGLTGRQVDLFEDVAHLVLEPILGTALTLQNHAAIRPESALTEAEMRVARMAAEGMSYKEIAIALDRSFHTIDHQLRSVRAKLGVSSHAQLVRRMSSAMSNGYAGAPVPSA